MFHAKILFVEGILLVFLCIRTFVFVTCWYSEKLQKRHLREHKVWVKTKSVTAE